MENLFTDQWTVDNSVDITLPTESYSYNWFSCFIESLEWKWTISASFIKSRHNIPKQFQQMLLNLLLNHLSPQAILSAYWQKFQKSSQILSLYFGSMVKISHYFKIFFFLMSYQKNSIPFRKLLFEIWIMSLKPFKEKYKKGKYGKYIDLVHILLSREK